MPVVQIIRDTGTTRVHFLFRRLWYQTGTAAKIYASSKKLARTPSHVALLQLQIFAVLTQITTKLYVSYRLLPITRVRITLRKPISYLYYA